MRNILRQVFFFEAQGCDQSKNLLNSPHSRKYEMSDRKSAESTVGPVLSDVCHVKNDNCPFIKYLGGPNYNWEMRVFKYKPLFGFLIIFAQSPPCSQSQPLSFVIDKKNFKITFFRSLKLENHTYKFIETWNSYYLLAPSGALIAIPTYYWSTTSSSTPTFSAPPLFLLSFDFFRIFIYHNFHLLSFHFEENKAFLSHFSFLSLNPLNWLDSWSKSLFYQSIDWAFCWHNI